MIFMQSIDFEIVHGRKSRQKTMLIRFFALSSVGDLFLTVHVHPCCFGKT